MTSVTISVVSFSLPVNMIGVVKYTVSLPAVFQSGFQIYLAFEEIPEVVPQIGLEFVNTRSLGVN